MEIRNAVNNSRLICLQEEIFLLYSGEVGDHQSTSFNRETRGIFKGISAAFTLSRILQH
jgi:hypothetical protein